MCSVNGKISPAFLSRRNPVYSHLQSKVHNKMRRTPFAMSSLSKWVDAKAP